MKKIVAVLLSAAMVLGLCACGSTDGPTINEEYKTEIAAAAKKLSDTYSNYVISNSVERDSSGYEYIECVKGGDVYTEYSVDEEGYLGTIQYGSVETASYILSDWTHDGKYYSFTVDDEGNDAIYLFPSSYATKYNYDREMLWANRLLAGALSIEPYNTIQLTTADGISDLKTFKMTVSGSTIADLFSAESKGTYLALKDEEKSGTNIAKLCDYCIDDYEKVNVYADAEVLVGIDENGILKYVEIAVGGLGTMMYMTKIVADVRNPNVRDLPDFTGSVPIASTLVELADFVAQYPDYDSAMSALYSMSDDMGVSATQLPNLTTSDELDGADTSDELDGVDTGADVES